MLVFTSTDLEQLVWTAPVYDSLRFECNCDLSSTLFAGRLIGQSVLAVGCHFVGACAMTTHQLQICGQYCITLKQSEKVHRQKNNVEIGG